MRRVAARTWLLVIWRLALSSGNQMTKERVALDSKESGLGALGRLGQQVLELERKPFQVPHLLLRSGGEEGRGDDAGDGDAEPHGGVVERLGDTLGEEGGPLLRLRGRD